MSNILKLWLSGKNVEHMFFVDLQPIPLLHVKLPLSTKHGIYTGDIRELLLHQSFSSLSLFQPLKFLYISINLLFIYNYCLMIQ